MKYIKKINESREPSEYYQAILDNFSDIYRIYEFVNKKQITISCDTLCVFGGGSLEASMLSLDKANLVINNYKLLLNEISNMKEKLDMDSVDYIINFFNYGNDRNMDIEIKINS